MYVPKNPFAYFCYLSILMNPGCINFQGICGISEEKKLRLREA